MKKIYIEISDICGLECSFCTAPKGIRGIMDIETFKIAVREAKKHTNLITLHILGDPMRVKNLCEYLKIAHDSRLQVELTTSGAFLGEFSDLSFLLDSPIRQVNFSLDAIIEHKNCEKFLREILAFCDFKKARDSRIFVNIRVQKRARNRALLETLSAHFGVNLGENLMDSRKDSRIKLGNKIILDFRDIFEWQDLGESKSLKTHPLAPSARDGEYIDSFGLSPTYFLKKSKQKTLDFSDSSESTQTFCGDFKGQCPLTKTPPPLGGDSTSPSPCGRGLGGGVIPKNLQNPQNKIAQNSLTLPHQKNGTCHALKNHIGILSNGEIVPCCIDTQGTLSLGNIKDLSIKSALNSHRAQKMLKGFRENRIIEPFCKMCNYRKRFDLSRDFAEI